MRLPRLDVVLGLAAGTVDVLIDGAPADSVEAGDDEAGVYPLRPGLDAGDDALDAVPTRGAIVEFLEAAQFLAACRGGPRSDALLQRRDVFPQCGGGRHAQRVVEPLGAAEAQHLGCAVV